MRILRHPSTLIALATVAGILAGLVIGEPAAQLKVLGDLFLRLIQMAIVPLVMASVIVGVASLSGAGTGRLALRTFSWMLGFSVVAAALAYGLAAVLRPGARVATDLAAAPDVDAAAPSTWQETLLGFVPTNIVESMGAGDMVPLIVFSLLAGLALNRVVETTGNRLVLEAVAQVQAVVLGMITIVMKLAPIGVFCLLAALAGQMGASVILAGLSYLGTTALGVVIILALFLVVLALRTGLNPLRLPAKLAEQTVIAVTTTSSAVTFPTVLRTAVEKLGVSSRVANFTLSVGLSMGSYGAVLNYVIVIVFLAQSGGMELGPAQIAAGMGLAILLNLGTVTVPGGFPVVAMFIGTTMGLPLEALGLLIAVDWFTGVLRTLLNVSGDTFVALLVAVPEGELDREVYDRREEPGTPDDLGAADGPSQPAARGEEPAPGTSALAPRSGDQHEPEPALERAATP